MDSPRWREKLVDCIKDCGSLPDEKIPVQLFPALEKGSILPLLIQDIERATIKIFLNLPFKEDLPLLGRDEGGYPFAAFPVEEGGERIIVVLWPCYRTLDGKRELIWKIEDSSGRHFGPLHVVNQKALEELCLLLNNEASS